MRSLRSQGLIHDQNYALFPQGAIINETDSAEGTPVVREVYNDTLMNLYALLHNRKINLNNLEDNEINGYQVLKALGLVFNEMVDSYKVLSKSGLTWNIDLDLSLALTGTVFFVRVSDLSAVDSTIVLRDKTGSEFNVSVKTNLQSGDDCILVFDNNDSRIFSLNPISIQNSNLNNLVTYGNPINQNDSALKIWYFKDGVLSNMQLEFYDLLTIVKNHYGDESLIIKDLIQIDGDFIGLIYRPLDFKYWVVSFKNNTFNQFVELDSVDQPISENQTEDLKVHFYASEKDIYISNQGGNSNSDFIMAKYVYDKMNDQLDFQVNLNLYSDFDKNQNTIFFNNKFIFLNNQGISKYSLNGDKEKILTYGQLSGQLFKAGKNAYFNDGYNALKIEL